MGNLEHFGRARYCTAAALTCRKMSCEENNKSRGPAELIWVEEGSIVFERLRCGSRDCEAFALGKNLADPIKVDIVTDLEQTEEHYKCERSGDNRAIYEVDTLYNTAYVLVAPSI